MTHITLTRQRFVSSSDDTWVREVISEELINKAIEMASAGHDTFKQIPIGVKTKLLDKAVVRVKCIPYSKSTVVDTKALANETAADKEKAG